MCFLLEILIIEFNPHIQRSLKWHELEDIKNFRLEAKEKVEQAEFEYAQNVIKQLSNYYDGKVVGQQNLKFALVASIIAEGHVLIESVPGLAKTTAAKTISDAVDGKFSRIQCTPDLLPSDIIGTQVYNQSTGEFETTLGPVFANFVLLDEINRSSAKTQSAMLEAMQERQVTIGGKTYRMPGDVFIVIATQNPIEQEGTYLLSEAPFHYQGKDHLSNTSGRGRDSWQNRGWSYKEDSTCSYYTGC